MSETQPTRVNSEDELDIQLNALAVWRADEVVVSVTPGADAHIRFTDASSIERVIVFDTSAISVETAQRQVLHLTGMVYRGSSSATGGDANHIYNRG